MAQGYHPELDVTDKLNQYGITKFQELIRILWWAIEIGGVDILFELSAGSSP